MSEEKCKYEPIENLIDEENKSVMGKVADSVSSAGSNVIGAVKTGVTSTATTISDASIGAFNTVSSKVTSMTQSSIDLMISNGIDQAINALSMANDKIDERMNDQDTVITTVCFNVGTVQVSMQNTHKVQKKD